MEVLCACMFCIPCTQLRLRTGSVVSDIWDLGVQDVRASLVYQVEGDLIATKEVEGRISSR